MPSVIHFEINAEDPERAAEFYRKVFGWEIEKWEGPVDYWLINTVEDDEPGINGAIKDRSDDLITVNTIGVPSIDQFTKKVLKAGGKVLMEKTPVPGVGYHAYCEDSEGNVFGIMEENPTA